MKPPKKHRELKGHRLRKKMSALARIEHPTHPTDPRDEIKKLSKAAGMNRRDLARQLGVCESTAYRWGNQLPVPKYALVFLELFAEYRKLERQNIRMERKLAKEAA